MQWFCKCCYFVCLPLNITFHFVGVFKIINMYFISASGKSLKLYEQNIPDWVPSINISLDQTVIYPTCKQLNRHERTIERETKRKSQQHSQYFNSNNSRTSQRRMFNKWIVQSPMNLLVLLRQSLKNDKKSFYTGISNYLTLMTVIATLKIISLTQEGQPC